MQEVEDDKGPLEDAAEELLPEVPSNDHTYCLIDAKVLPKIPANDHTYSLPVSKVLKVNLDLAVQNLEKINRKVKSDRQK